MMLDATAGNRIMWRGRRPPVEHVVFLDRETKLAVPPTIFADHRMCPFRDDIFNCVIYDPPFMARSKPPPYWNDPQQRYVPKVGKAWGRVRNKWWGIPKTKGELLGTINKAQKEFQRLTKRLCLKWVEVDYPLFKILPFFRDWKIIRKQGFKRGKRGSATVLVASEDKNCKTHWVTFIQSSEGKANA